MTERKTENEQRPPDPIFTVARYQRVRVIVAVICVGVLLGVLLWRVLAA